MPTRRFGGSESCHPDAIDILRAFTDAIMPGMNATELVTRLQKRLPNIRVVLMSGPPPTYWPPEACFSPR